MDELELDDLADAGAPASGGHLQIRIDRDAEISAAYDGELIPVTSIDIDQASIDRLTAQPRTVRDQ